MPFISIVVVVLLCAIFVLIKRKKSKERINKFTFNMMFMLGVALVLYIGIIVLISPELEYFHTLRYIMSVLPIITILLLVLIDSCFGMHKKISEGILIFLTIIISVYGLIISEPSFLYKGYNNYLKIANENKHVKFVYVGDTVFNHIQSMQEFCIYDESLILNENEIDYILNDEKLKNEDEFILSIKKYKGADEILEKIVSQSEFKNYELLLDDNGDVGCKIFRMMR